MGPRFGAVIFLNWLAGFGWGTRLKALRQYAVFEVGVESNNQQAMPLQLF